MSNVQAFRTALARINSLEELREINSACIDRMRSLSYQKATEFRRGDKVEYDSRRGFTVSGTIEKVMQKNVIVVPDDKGYPRQRVPAAMLRAKVAS